MRALLFSVIVLFASAAQAQTIWQMNAAYQNQINTAQQAAMPVYGYGYGYGYAPAYRSYHPYYSTNLQRQALLYEAQNQTRALRQMNRTLRYMEWDLQDAARAQKGSVLESQMRDAAWMYEK